METTDVKNAVNENYIEDQMKQLDQYFLKEESRQNIAAYLRSILDKTPGHETVAFNFKIMSDKEQGIRFCTSLIDIINNVTGRKINKGYALSETDLLNSYTDVLSDAMKSNHVVIIDDCLTTSLTESEIQKWKEIDVIFSKYPSIPKILILSDESIQKRFHSPGNRTSMADHIFFRIFQNNISFMENFNTDDIKAALFRSLERHHYTWDEDFSNGIKTYIDDVYSNNPDLHNIPFVTDLESRIDTAYYHRKDLDKQLHQSEVPYHRVKSAIKPIAQNEEVKQEIPEAKPEEKPASTEMPVQNAAEKTETVTNTQDDIDSGSESPSKESPNILILSLSTFPTSDYLSNCTATYDGNKTIEYNYQLEPVVKMLISKLHDQGKTLDMIIMIGTNQTNNMHKQLFIQDGTNKKHFIFKDQPEGEITPEQYFKYKINQYVDTYFKDGQIVDVQRPVYISYLYESLPDTSERNDSCNHPFSTSELISQVVNLIRKKAKANKNPTIYMDIHGGYRATSQILIYMISLLKIEGIPVYPENIYSVEEVERPRFIITKAEQAVRVLDFITGLNELMNYARTDSLENYINKLQNPKEKALINSCKSIATSIQLCNMTGFEKGLDQLKNSIDNFENDKSSKNTGRYLYLFLNDIKRNYRELLDHDDERLIAEIRWCLGKGFYQQMLTLIESKIPDYFCKGDHPIINYNESIKEDADWYINKDAYRNISRRGNPCSPHDFYNQAIYHPNSHLRGEKPSKIELFIENRFFTENSEYIAEEITSRSYKLKDNISDDQKELLYLYNAFKSFRHNSNHASDKANFENVNIRLLEKEAKNFVYLIGVVQSSKRTMYWRGKNPSQNTVNAVLENLKKYEKGDIPDKPQPQLNEKSARMIIHSKWEFIKMPKTSNSYSDFFTDPSNQLFINLYDKWAQVENGNQNTSLEIQCNHDKESVEKQLDNMIKWVINNSSKIESIIQKDINNQNDTSIAQH